MIEMGNPNWRFLQFVDDFNIDEFLWTGTQEDEQKKAASFSPRDCCIDHSTHKC